MTFFISLVLVACTVAIVWGDTVYVKKFMDDDK
jgi:hypothetical protein